MKQKLIKNLDLKILAILFSIIIWLIVVNIDDPVKSVQFSGVNVRILNASELEKQGKFYEVKDETDNITVTVVGRRSIIEDLSKENISATADMNDLTSMDTISIVLSSNKYSNDLDSLKSNIDTVKLNIEDIKRIQRAIQTDIQGTPADGFILGDLNVNLNRINIEGPESVVSLISSAKVVLDVEGVSSTVIASAPIRLYDAAGEPINDSRISMNASSVSLTQEVLVKKEVPVIFKVGGVPAEGYTLTGDVKAPLYKVEIAGRRNAVDTVTAIVIPEDKLNVEGLKSSLKTKVNIEDYVPFNVELADKEQETEIEVIVEIQRETFINVPYSDDSVRFTNVPEGYTVSVVHDGTYFKNGENSLRLYGLPENVNNYDESQFYIEVDLAKYMEEHNLKTLTTGVFWVEPKLNIPTGIHLNDTFRIEVKSEKK